MPNMKKTDRPAPTAKSSATNPWNTSPFLSDEEIDNICDGYIQNAAKVRHLAGKGITVHTKPNGRPLVARKQFDSVVCGPTLHLQSEPKWRLV
jgi:hypothetical protein